jgi:heme/copper-type cytochrome/quinol oxidase subunit 2
VRAIANWNPTSTLANAVRIQFGNPVGPHGAGAPWAIRHPMAYTIIWIVGIVVVCAPLAVRLYQRSISK